jgi:hypothetical protein
VSLCDVTVMVTTPDGADDAKEVNDVKPVKQLAVDNPKVEDVIV